MLNGMYNLKREKLAMNHQRTHVVNHQDRIPGMLPIVRNISSN